MATTSQPQSQAPLPCQTAWHGPQQARQYYRYTIISDALLTVTAQAEASKLLFLFMWNANGYS